MNKKLFISIFMFIIIFTLGGCSSVIDSVLTSNSPEVVFKKAIEAHDEVDSVEVSFEEILDEYSDTGLMKIDFDKDESEIALNEDGISVYLNDEDILVKYSDGEVESWTGTEMFLDIENKVKHQQNPLKFFTQIDGEIYNKFDMEKEKDNYVLTYNGAGDDKLLLGKAIAYFELTGMDDFDEMLDYFDVEVSSFDLKLVIDSSSFLLKNTEHHLVYNFPEEDEDTVTGLIHTYDTYNKVDKIEQLVATVKEGEGLNQRTDNSGDPGDLSDKEIKQHETDASAYLDALIEATVFQNAEDFIKKAPESMSADDKNTEGELQRDYFREMYMENTKNNMVDTGVTDEEVTKLTDAFLHAISTAKYEVVDAVLESPSNIIVTVSVEGIDDTAIYTKTEDEMYDVVVEGKVEEEDFISKNMEILIDNYREVDSLLDPVEVEVNVTVDDNGYLVMTQDEFLIGGFVQ